MIHAGGSIDILTRFVENEVEFPGRLIEMELEGQPTGGIWLGEFRAAKGGAGAAKPLLILA